MSDQRKKGTKGEEIAVAYLRQLGYNILETNWFYRHFEIDIIASTSSVLVFVEVKMRQNAGEAAREAVSRKKQRFIIEAANAYIERFDNSMPVRFDVVMVYCGQGMSVEHFEDAFSPWG